MEKYSNTLKCFFKGLKVMCFRYYFVFRYEELFFQIDLPFNQNHLTAEGAKERRKGRKELNSYVLALRSLRYLCVLCG